MFGLTNAILVVGITLSLLFCWRNYQKGKRLPSGTATMRDIAAQIKTGSLAFLRREFRVSMPIMGVIALLFSAIFHPFCGIAYAIGAAVSSLSGIIGMKAAVIYNEKVANAARLAVEEKMSQHEAQSKAGKIAIRGGSIMGFSVKSLVLLGLLIIVVVGGQLLSFADPANMGTLTSFVPFFGIEYVMIIQILTCFTLGCSTVAVFNRLGGGIFTKGADMGADQVGKTEMNLPEDSPLNPAVIADCVGDNVGDVAGNGSDLNESTAGAIVSAMVLAIILYTSSLSSSQPISASLFSNMFLYPLAFAGVGLLACLVGVAYVIATKKRQKTNSVDRDLNLSLWGSALIIAIGTFLLTFVFFGRQSSLHNESFVLGWISPWIGALTGIAAGIIMGILAERYTSDRYKATRHLADLSKQGPALVCVGGIELGWRSCMPYGITFALTILVASYVAGLYGVAMAAVGMLSFVAAAVTIDSYGPVVDNSGGIAEMSGLPALVRGITDSLDSLGNVTAAIGKGFAIGSGVLAALSMQMSFSQSGKTTLDLMDPLLLVGTFVGGPLMYWLSGKMLQAVGENAKGMVNEVRKQFPAIQKGGKPDPARCIDVCTSHALKLMRAPVIVSMSVPVISGIIGGPVLVAGVVFGTITVSVVMAIATANSGGAWDNAKKYVKAQSEAIISDLGEEKYREMHNAAVVGDTVGDGFKDVVGPNQDIMIKMMSTVALIFLPVFAQFNLLSFIF